MAAERPRASHHDFSIATLERELEALLDVPGFWGARGLRQRRQALALMRQMEHAPGGASQQRSALCARVAEADQRLFDQVRQGMRSGDLRGDKLRRYLEQFTDYRAPGAGARLMGYDLLDDLWAGVCGFEHTPGPCLPPEPEMVHLEHTPARVVLALLDRWPAPGDGHVMDIGAGLGQVALMLAALSDLRASGIEVDLAYADFARRATSCLGLEQISIVACDARQADYADVDLAFMFTPFVGDMLQRVLERMRLQCAGRPFWIASYGPSSLALASAPWLTVADDVPVDPFRLDLFVSRA